MVRMRCAVHDVVAMRDVVRVVEAIARASQLD